LLPREQLSMSEKRENVVSASPDSDQNVDKIREILFGANMREYEQRFASLEQRLIAENDKLGQFLEKRLTGIATATQRELAGLAAQIEDQKRSLAALDEESRSGLASITHQLGERLNDLDDSLGKEAQSLRNDLSEQYNELAGLVKKTRDSLSESMQRENGRLEQAKLGREELSTLLAGLAGRLRQDAAGDGD